MSDHKPMSVDQCKVRVLQAFYGGHYDKLDIEYVDDLISAVRAEERAKCAHEKTEALVSLQQCNNRAAEFVRGQERARVLAEFRKLAEELKKPPESFRWRVPFEKCAEKLYTIIQSLETPNQKP